MSRDPLRTEATRLLTALRSAGATHREGAIPDHRLAELTHLDQRAIIDAARELLNAGVFVLASCGKTPGRWVGTATEALAYRGQIERRVRRMAGRISAIDAALAANRGQLDLKFSAYPL